MGSITLPAFAKINLCLDITGKRPDGYHLLETVMHSISLCDIITVAMTDTGRTEVFCTDSSIPSDGRNIACKCAEAFFAETGIKNSGINIRIEKNIPSQAGLGGGSSDGAAVLSCLNTYYRAGLSEEELCRIGAGVGADVPFCILGGCRLCRGIGEITEPLPRLNGKVVVGKGNMGISTKEAFEKIDSKGCRFLDFDVKKRFLEISSLAEAATLCVNAFEAVTDCPDVERIKSIMFEGGALCSCMTGSGSAVFGLYEDEKAAALTCGELKNMGYFAGVYEFI